jgi:hypothetical protein
MQLQYVTSHEAEIFQETIKSGLRRLDTMQWGYNILVTSRYNIEIFVFRLRHIAGG